MMSVERSAAAVTMESNSDASTAMTDQEVGSLARELANAYNHMAPSIATNSSSPVPRPTPGPAAPNTPIKKRPKISNASSSGHPTR